MRSVAVEHMAPAGAGNGIGTCSRSAGGPPQASAVVKVFVANVYFGTLSASVGVLVVVGGLSMFQTSWCCVLCRW